MGSLTQIRSNKSGCSYQSWNNGLHAAYKLLPRYFREAAFSMRKHIGRTSGKGAPEKPQHPTTSMGCRKRILPPFSTRRQNIAKSWSKMQRTKPIWGVDPWIPSQWEWWIPSLEVDKRGRVKQVIRPVAKQHSANRAGSDYKIFEARKDILHSVSSLVFERHWPDWEPSKKPSWVEMSEGALHTTEDQQQRQGCSLQYGFPKVKHRYLNFTWFVKKYFF